MKFLAHFCWILVAFSEVSPLVETIAQNCFLAFFDLAKPAAALSVLLTKLPVGLKIYFLLKVSVCSIVWTFSEEPATYRLSDLFHRPATCRQYDTFSTMISAVSLALTNIDLLNVDCRCLDETRYD